MYQTKSTVLQIVCRHNLEIIKLKTYEEVSLFFDDFERAVNELKQAGAVIREQETLNYILKSLPQNYSHIGDLIDVLPEKERTVDYLKSKIKLKNAEEKSSGVSKDNSNAFQTETRIASQKNCFNCGKPGHFQKDCHTRGRGRGYFGNRGRGYSGSRGHGYSGYRGRGSSNSRNFHKERKY
ncbi:hypothetical protein JTB14_023613 [Gonioctena quinquepunctata]|nr:hypothetical protein JTB14_023613 [Gonioctena quinquepunctata]